MSILVVEDDWELAELLAFTFHRAGLRTLTAHDVPGAVALLDQERPELAVLDIQLGRDSGLDILRELRRRWCDLPVIMLTALGSEDDKVRCLDLGACDYVTKPFSHRELVARVRAQLRHATSAFGTAAAGASRAVAPLTDPVEVGPLLLRAATHEVTLNGRPLALTPTEFRLLQALMVAASTVVSTRTLLRNVWGYDDLSAAGADVVRVAVHRLRRKLAGEPGDSDEATAGQGAARLLQTIPGVGIILRAPDPVPLA